MDLDWTHLPMVKGWDGPIIVWALEMSLVVSWQLPKRELELLWLTSLWYTFLLGCCILACAFWANMAHCPFDLLQDESIHVLCEGLYHDHCCIVVHVIKINLWQTSTPLSLERQSVLSELHTNDNLCFLLLHVTWHTDSRVLIETMLVMPHVLNQNTRLPRYPCLTADDAPAFLWWLRACPTGRFQWAKSDSPSCHWWCRSQGKGIFGMILLYQARCLFVSVPHHLDEHCTALFLFVVLDLP